MNRVYNFSAGPSVLPEEVLKKAQDQLISYKDSGMSVMEMSHRSKVFQGIIDSTEQMVREVLGISEDYHVLFLQGGASMQFAMVPMNLLTGTKKVDLIDTGAWSKKAATEAARFGEVNIAATSKDKNYTYIPDTYTLQDDAEYVHITTNNTIYGTRYTELPDTGGIPLVADMSSNIASEPMDFSKVAIAYAGAQKNLGPAGVTLVIVRKDLVGKAADTVPTMLNYKTHADKGSMFNTPPTFAIYMLGLVMEWVKEQGGVKVIGEKNRKKADLLYKYIDESKLYTGTVVKKDRSIMNVPFILENDDLTQAFLDQAGKNGLVNLKGHRSVGGCRASIYNAMPEEGVNALINFMREFEKANY
ncbi:MAG: 3-phosphoserine/phosphohydroxythreonine transaminase [Spirochaetia bacterium]